MKKLSNADLAARIDHAVLSPGSTERDIAVVAGRCAGAGVRGLCVAPRHVVCARRSLREGEVRVAAVAGFPAGSSVSEVLCGEIRRAVRDGADEIDVVYPWGRVIETRGRAGGRDEIAALVDAAEGRAVKLIVEVSELDDTEIERWIVETVAPSQIAFLKTGTGVYGRPLPTARVRRIRGWLPEILGLKVAGGIRDRVSAQEMLDAGADLLGTGRTFEILREQP
jgi:deoxyribose-phosphate aldolase